MPRNLRSTVLSLLALSAVLFTAGAANAQDLDIVTTAAGSFTNSMGSAVAKVIVEDAGMRATVSPQQSHGQESVNDGSSALSIATISDVQQYVTGTADWEGKGPKKNIRLIARLVPILTTGLVKIDSDIKTLKDVKGKRVPTEFPAQKSVWRVVQGQLNGAGVSENDVKGVPARNIIQSANDFAAGKTDIFWFALGSAKVKQVDAAVGGLRSVPVETSPAAIKAMQKFVPGSYVVTLKPSKANETIKTDTPVLAYDVVLFTNPNLSEEAVYKLTKAIHDNKKKMAGVFPVFNRFEPAGMAKNYNDLEYHPGAVKYYKEQGMWPPKSGS
jgi:hypothetical protein